MIKFRKIFQIYEEGEEINSIIAYRKFPYIVTRKEIKHDQYVTSTNLHYDFVNQYQKYLFIDLYLFCLSFRWKTKFKE
jgi:hypothetical protein